MKEEYKFTDYGLCVGIRDAEGVQYVKPHIFNDGYIHLQDSQSLCKDCKIMTYYLNGIDNLLSDEEYNQLEDMLALTYFKGITKNARNNFVNE